MSDTGSAFTRFHIRNVTRKPRKNIRPSLAGKMRLPARFWGTVVPVGWRKLAGSRQKALSNWPTSTRCSAKRASSDSSMPSPSAWMKETMLLLLGTLWPLVFDGNRVALITRSCALPTNGLHLHFGYLPRAAQYLRLTTVEWICSCLQKQRRRSYGQNMPIGYRRTPTGCRRPGLPLSYVGTSAIGRFLPFRPDWR